MRDCACSQHLRAIPITAAGAEALIAARERYDAGGPEAAALPPTLLEVVCRSEDTLRFIEPQQVLAQQGQVNTHNNNAKEFYPM